MSLESEIANLAAAIRELTAAATAAGKAARPAPAEDRAATFTEGKKEAKAKADAAIAKTTKAAKPAAPKDSAPAEADVPAGLVYADVMKALMAVINALGRDRALEILAADPFGVTNAKELSKDKWPALIKACDAAMRAATEGEDNA